MRALLWMLCGVVLLSACKGCGDPCDEVACVNGGVCIEGECVVPTCDPECADGEFCDDGLCVPVEVQCAQAGDTCNASGEIAEPFICLDLDGFGPQPGVCSEPCASDGTCSAGALCFYLSSAADPACTTTADCDAGRECADGLCLRTVCRPSECDGFVDGATTCSDLYASNPNYSDGAQCYNVGNDARYCYPAGPRTEGESCGDVIDAIIGANYADTCASGLACVDNICRQACQADAVCGDLECILEETNLIDDGTGICGSSCTPFEVGSCGDGETCIPVSATEGVCAPAGDREAFEVCTPGAGECSDGNLCVQFQNDPLIGRCQPMCNLTVGEANDDGSVGEFAQSQRDATCPQSAPSESFVLVTNLAELGSGIDIYLGTEPAPLVADLGLDASTAWVEIEPGTQTLRLLPAGAASTDPPLAEQTVSFVSATSTRVHILPSAGTLDEVELLAEDTAATTLPAAGFANVRAVAALADVPLIDVLLVPPGDDLTDPSTHIELAADLATGAGAAAVEVAATDWDLLVFPSGDPRTDRATALISTNFTLTDELNYTLALRGTVDPDDLPLAAAALLNDAEVPNAQDGGPTFTCVDPGGGAVGYCQQSCPGARGFDGICQGDGMGCLPSYLNANGRWASLCAPLGAKALDETCDPFAEFSECAEGLYCLEYGNTVPDYSALARGRCVSLCVDGAPDDPNLRCGAGQSCERISFNNGYEIGRCGFECTPDTSYQDAACPEGLKSCTPKAQLVDDLTDPGALPAVITTPSYCSSSGDIAAGDRCTGADCMPGSECMFPRSEQTDFTSTLLSQYFGAAGLAPACTPQCDPFEGDSSSTSCAAGETCLFNYPYSAEVGHCAPIDVEVEPLGACSNPGKACGEDSICVINGSPTCFQFCQYSGPDAAGQAQAESCAAGLACFPLVNDIGICLPPA